MSETAVDKSLCGAPCCNMIATSSRGTTSDSKEWLCFIHFAAEGQDWGRTSDELGRLSWLVAIVRDLRAVGRRKNYDEVQASAKQQITLAQRGDLLMKESESVGSWMIRLEGVLQQSCREACK